MDKAERNSFPNKSTCLHVVHIALIVFHILLGISGLTLIALLLVRGPSSIYMYSISHVYLYGEKISMLRGLAITLSISHMILSMLGCCCLVRMDDYEEISQDKNQGKLLYLQMALLTCMMLVVTAVLLVLELKYHHPAGQHTMSEQEVQKLEQDITPDKIEFFQENLECCFKKANKDNAKSCPHQQQSESCTHKIHDNVERGNVWYMGVSVSLSINYLIGITLLSLHISWTTMQT